MDRRQPHQNRQPYRDREQTNAPSEQVLRTIIVEGDPEAMVNVAKEVGKTLEEKNLRTSQIRNFFGAVREIEMNWPDSRAGNFGEEELRRGKESQRRFLLLKPKLAYYVGKERGYPQEALRYLEKVLSPAIDLAKDDRAHFGNFVEFFEAILAYHKFYGGRDQ